MIHNGIGNESLAAGFAACAHRNQVRKYTGEPYVKHCAEVASLLHEICRPVLSVSMLQAAWLHDTLEDTDVTEDQLRFVFGTYTTRLVVGLTDIAKPALGNRATRKAFDRDRLAAEISDVQTIKCCDLISNTSTIVNHDPNFAKVYLREKREILDVMTKAYPAARRRAYAVLVAAETKLMESFHG